MCWRVAFATTRDSGGKADEKTAQRLAGCKRIVYGLLNGRALPAAPFLDSFIALRSLLGYDITRPPMQPSS